MAAPRIGELLIKEKYINVQQLQEALTFQKAHGCRLGTSLVMLGHIKDEQILQLLSQKLGVASINLSRCEVAPDVLKLVPNETANRYHIIPLAKAGAKLTVATTDPANQLALDDIKFLTGFDEVEPVLASDLGMAEAIVKYYPPGTPQTTTQLH